MTHELLNRSAVVTGGAGDIGLAIARKLVASGCSVSLWDLEDRDEARVFAAEHDTVELITCDLTDVESVADAAERTRRHNGTTRILVNAIGIGHHSRFEDMTSDEWTRVIDVNLCGPMHAVRALLDDLRAERGVVLNLCSIWSRATGINRSAYIASKWGLLAATQSLAEEFREDGIRFTALSPGLVNTRMSGRLAPTEVKEQWIQPHELAEMALFAVSDAATAMTGGELQAYGWIRPPGMGA